MDFNLQVGNILEAKQEVVKLQSDNSEGDVPGAEIQYLGEFIIMCIYQMKYHNVYDEISNSGLESSLKSKILDLQ